MGLFRTAVIAGVVIALMPTERNQQSRMSDQVAGAAKWAFTYCDRNPATCLQAAEAWAVFVKKAEFAAKLGYDLVQERMNRGDNAAAAPTAAPTPPQMASDRDAREPKALERGTLTPLDLKPGWRGSSGGSGAIPNGRSGA